MSKLACRYAIVRFAPYPETEEFANVGIVVTCPRTGYFDFKVETRRYGRITQFFDDMDGKLYRVAMHHFSEELTRVKGALFAAGPDELRAAFTHLTRPREAIVRFSQERAALTERPQQLLEELFDHYVSRNFVTHEYREQNLEKSVTKMVSELRLAQPFKQERVGPKDFNVNFPLVQHRPDAAARIIKPLFLGQDEPNKIYQHGDTWIARMRRLLKVIDRAPEVLFAVRLPDSSCSDGQREAARSIAHDLQNEIAQVTVVEAGNREAILAFATS